MVTTSHDPSFLSSLYIIGNGTRVTAEYTRTSESSVTTASARPSTHSLASCASASYGLHTHSTLTLSEESAAAPPSTSSCPPQRFATAAATTFAMISVPRTHCKYFSPASLFMPRDLSLLASSRFFLRLASRSAFVPPLSGTRTPSKTRYIFAIPALISSSRHLSRTYPV